METCTSKKTLSIPLTGIDPTLLPHTRANVDGDTVREYAECIQSGGFPPILVWSATGQAPWAIVDGRHRYEAAATAGMKSIDAESLDGDRDTAVAKSCAANAQHGLRRSNADKRRCVEIALGQWPGRSDRALGELCGLSNTLVGAVRAQLSKVDSCTGPAKRIGLDGKARHLPKQTAAKMPTELETAANQVGANAQAAHETTRDSWPMWRGLYAMPQIDKLLNQLIDAHGSDVEWRLRLAKKLRYWANQLEGRVVDA